MVRIIGNLINLIIDGIIFRIMTCLFIVSECAKDSSSHYITTHIHALEIPINHFLLGTYDAAVGTT